MKRVFSLLLAGVLCLLLLLPGCGRQDANTVLIPAEAVSQARALFLLQEAGLLTLRDGAALDATVNDIAENPYDLVIEPVPSEKLSRQLPQAALAVMGAEAAYAAGLDPAQALRRESSFALYAGVIAMRAEEAGRDAGKALAAAARSRIVADQLKYTFGTNVASAALQPGDGRDPSVDYANLLHIRLTVAAFEQPQAAILQWIADVLREQEIQMEVKLYTDPAQANHDLIAEKVDAVYMQDALQLEAYNIANGTKLTPIAQVHAAPMGVYAGTAASIAALTDAE